MGSSSRRWGEGGGGGSRNEDGVERGGGGCKLKLASVSTFASLSWIPAHRCDVYLPVRLEVRHLVLHVCD